MDAPNRYPSYRSSSTSRIPASSAVGPNAYPDEDWTKVADLSERRRIQNRIAQRNFRQKMKKGVGKVDKRAQSSSPERSRDQSNESREQHMATQRRSARHGTPMGSAAISASQSTIEAPASSQQTQRRIDEPALQPLPYSQPMFDPAFLTHSDPVYSTPYDHTSMAYANFPEYSQHAGYYINNPAQPSPSLSPPQYSGADGEFYTPGEFPAEYDMRFAGTAEPYTSHAQSDPYAHIHPQMYAYEVTPDGSTPGFRDTDPRVQDPNNPQNSPFPPF